MDFEVGDIVICNDPRFLYPCGNVYRGPRPILGSRYTVSSVTENCIGLAEIAEGKPWWALKTDMPCGVIYHFRKEENIIYEKPFPARRRMILCNTSS